MTGIQRENSITVFFPAFNDAKSIVPLVMNALAVLPSLAADYEVIVINDGSEDDTASVLEATASVIVGDTLFLDKRRRHGIPELRAAAHRDQFIDSISDRWRQHNRR